jgi:tetratricopeptide (TPR) repeat protein
MGDCERALDAALAAAREAGDGRRATLILAEVPVAALWGPHPVTRASGRCLDVVRALRITGRSAVVEAVSMRCQSVLEALRGRPGPARRLLATARASLDELGHERGLLELDLATGRIELLAEDLEGADAALRRARVGFQRLGIDADAALAAGLLARVCVQRGDPEAALALTAESEQLAGDDLRAGITWRTVRAEALAAKGEVGEARRLAEEAVERAAATDALVDHADALLALAEVLRRSDLPVEAAVQALAALELYERKGATVGAARARRVGDRTPPPAAPAGSVAPLAEGAGGEVRTLALASVDAGMHALLDERWDDLEARLSPQVVVEDRRAVIGGSSLVGVRAAMDEFKAIRATGLRTVEVRPLEVRGERLCLVHQRWGSDLVAVDALALYAVDDDGRLLLTSTYDLDQRAAAVADLDALAAGFVAGVEAIASFCQRWIDALLAADWDAVQALFAADIVGVDHRSLVGGGDPIVGRAANLAANRGVVEVGVTSLRLVPVEARNDRVVLFRAFYEGSVGDLEVLQLLALDEQGLLRHTEVFEVGQRAAALARLDELGAAGP